MLRSLALTLVLIGLVGFGRLAAGASAPTAGEGEGVAGKAVPIAEAVDVPGGALALSHESAIDSEKSESDGELWLAAGATPSPFPPAGRAGPERPASTSPGSCALAARRAPLRC